MMGDDEAVGTAEEQEAAPVGAPEEAAEPQDDPQGAGNPEDDDPQDGGDGRMKRVVTERNEYRTKLTDSEKRIAHLEGQLAAMERGTREHREPEPKPEDENALRTEFEKDAYGVTRKMMKAEAEATARSADRRDAGRMMDSHAGAKHPEFAQRLADLIEDMYPNDPHDLRYPLSIKTDRALREYDRRYGEKVRDRIPAAPPSGGGNAGAPADAGKVTEAAMEEAQARFHEGKENHPSGKGWGLRQIEGWRKKGLIDW